MIVESSEDIIRLSGPVRINYWEAIHTAIALTLERHPSGVIIDCGQITDLTPEGALTFQAAIDYVLEHEDARLIFANVPDEVQEVMRQVPQVRSQMVVVDTVEQARTSLDLLAEDPRAKKKGEKPKRAFDRTILTCLCPSEFDPHVLDITLELVSDLPAKVVLLMPIVVPREHPLQAPMHDVECKAQSFAEKAKAMLDERNIAYDLRLQRTRDLSTVVEEVSDEIDAAHVVISVAANHHEDEEMTRVFHTLLEKVNRSLLFVRGKIEEPALRR